MAPIRLARNLAHLRTVRLLRRTRGMVAQPLFDDVADRPASGSTEATRTIRVLVVDDEPDEALLARDVLRRRGCEARAVYDGELALAAIAEAPEQVDVVLTDLQMTGLSGLELCAQLRERHPDIPIIVATGQHSVETAVASLRAGAYDFVTKPLAVDAVVAAVERAAEWRHLKGEVLRLRREVDATRPVEGLLGESPAIVRVTDMIRRIADTDATTLITGESGTGKELVARALHAAGPRADLPFVAINCGAVPANLLESELFGHVKGAFTDARRDRPGLHEQAGDGTVFLDEIGEMPLEMQVKLLRVLQQRTVRPVGGDEELPFTARVVCATNRDLEQEVEAGRFREDLFYRVNVVSIALPPLRERGADVLLLAQHILRRIAARTGRKIEGFSPAAARKLVDYDWPGNVRELENSIERAVALTQLTEIAVDDLPDKLRHHASNRVTIETDDPATMITIGELEQRYIKRVLAAVGGNKARAARILGIDRRSLYRRLEEAHLHVPLHASA